MCGIIAITRNPEAAYEQPLAGILIDCLERLEYRGYDSAGIALLVGGMENDGADDAAIWRIRAAVSKQSLKELRKHAPSAPGPPRSDSAGIGHTRWATHGRPSEQNAHPHLDCTGNIAVVHNGIVENWRELAEELSRSGHELASETDSELIAHLIEDELRMDTSTQLHGIEATRRALQRITGSFAIAVLDTRLDGGLVVARRLSPLVVGMGGGMCMAASDLPALLGLSGNYYVLEDGEIAELTPESITAQDLDGHARTLHPIHVSWDIEAAQKSGYDDFMGKELHEQPAAVMDTLLGRFVSDGKLALDETRITDDELREVDKVFIVGCGSSFHSGLVVKHALEHWTRIPTEIDISSEFRYRDPILSSSSLVIGVSQSGETMDTLQAIHLARQLNAKVLAVSNVVDSSITRQSDGVLYTRAGPEIGVAATKTFSTQIVALQMLALYIAQLRGILYNDETSLIMDQLRDLPRLMRHALDRDEAVKSVAEDIAGQRDLFYIGRNTGYPVALEGALKMKEIAYLRAEAYPAGELKHGPIALIEPGTVVLAIATKGRLQKKMHANISEVKSRGAKVIAVANDGDTSTAALADHVLYVPETVSLLAPVVDVIPLQLLAYHVARFRGCDVDRPRNLAKTVTVE
ncbi:MAG: glutamine--fructose-6-phosphate transaminase (isomerizing) [Actinobacteria bacterium]|nr:glutamine--fructose-6-phosphate transaminase (isomerizing) [Actinomycetota bacterium]MCL5446568.1 glutamine--fructose-6-phosphate transaminase (isomerizing) [Actinomycetota bacterium]